MAAVADYDAYMEMFDTPYMAAYPAIDILSYEEEETAWESTDRSITDGDMAWAAAAGMYVVDTTPSWSEPRLVLTMESLTDWYFTNAVLAREPKARPVEFTRIGLSVIRDYDTPFEA